MKDMASFKKWFYDKVKLVNTTYDVPPCQISVLSHTDTTGKSYN